MRSAKARMLSSHRSLTRSGDAHRARRADVIVVPASRSARHLDFATSLAAASGAMLVVLCSKGARAVEVERRISSRGVHVRSLCIDVPDGYSIPGFASAADGAPELKVPNHDRSSDISTKRNIGILLARMLKWRRLVFLDDDIYQISPAELNLLAGRLDAHPIAAMISDDFPDNSVVCHANRLSGNEQDVFVSGSVLAVDCGRHDVSHFPNVYNEDWFFFYPYAVAREIGHAGTSKQLIYDPFEDPERAVGEEFGDLLAEGLFAWIQTDSGSNSRPWRFPPSGYWDDFRGGRQAFIDRAIEGFDRNDTFDVRAIGALEAASAQLARITSEHCMQFLELMREDQATWSRVFSNAEAPGGQREALDRLNLQVVSGSMAVA
jgi:hypothetical protein